MQLLLGPCHTCSEDLRLRSWLSCYQRPYIPSCLWQPTNGLHGRRRQRSAEHAGCNARHALQFCRAQPRTVGARPSTAKDAVERGLVEFHEEKDAAAALSLFQQALQLSPSAEEARAAAYNSACAHAKLKQWQQAADAVVQAINKHGESLSTALKDPDLVKLRERREWMDALDQIKGATSSDSLVRLQGEARAPFRLTRLILVGSLDAGAIVGLLFIISRLVSALKGGEAAPDLTETLKDFVINSAAVAALSAVLAWDVGNSNKEKRSIEREESLGRLQIRLGPDRVLPLAYLRGRIRPVILAGTSAFVAKAMAEAEPYKRSLRDRGVSIVPLRLHAADPKSSLASLKSEFKGAKAQQSKGFGDAKPPPTMPTPAEVLTVEDDKRWKVEPAAAEEWEAWLAEQKKEAAIKGGNIYLQVQLNGKVRASGEGRPPWQKMVDEMPTLDDVRTKFTDGLGRR